MYYKSFTIIIYNRNDITIVIYDLNYSGLYYKTTIVTNLALARSINYDRRILIYNHKDCYKLKRNLQSYKTFTVQATEQNYNPCLTTCHLSHHYTDYFPVDKMSR